MFTSCKKKWILFKFEDKQKKKQRSGKCDKAGSGKIKKRFRVFY